MRIAITKPLFAWDCLEDSPALQTIHKFLEAVPDGPLLASLRQARGKGRNDYPLHVLWGVVLLTIALRHPTIEACLAKLRRHQSLRRLIGIRSEKKVPQKWNVSRLLEVLGHPIVRHRMAYIGYEPQRETLKYRCPARQEGWPCAMSQTCNAGKRYGLTVRVKRQIDLRRFPPIPRATKKFERLYQGRTADERVHGRLKIFWGAEDGNVTGARRFHALVGAVMVVHAGFATLLASAPRRDGTLGKLRLGAIQKALQGKIAA